MLYSGWSITGPTRPSFAAISWASDTSAADHSPNKIFHRLGGCRMSSANKAKGVNGDLQGIKLAELSGQSNRQAGCLVK